MRRFILRVFFSAGTNFRGSRPIRKIRKKLEPAKFSCYTVFQDVTDGNASGLAPPTAGVREQWHNRHEFVDARSGLKRTFITAKP